MKWYLDKADCLMIPVFTLGLLQPGIYNLFSLQIIIYNFSPPKKKLENCASPTVMKGLET